jgi:putative adenylate-forming enzyme
LEEDSADRLKSYFKQDISEIYQCTEGFLGITDPASGKIVLNEMYIHVEKEWIDEKRFIPIITDFTRFTQPFIRYRLSDILVESENNDGIFTEIKKIEGRLDDILYFRMKNTDSLKPIFPDTIRGLFTQITELEDYILEQDALHRLTIMIKPYNEEFAKLIARNLENFILTNNISPIEMQCETLDIHDLNIKKRRIKSNFKLKEGLK